MPTRHALGAIDLRVHDHVEERSEGGRRRKSYHDLHQSIFAPESFTTLSQRTQFSLHEPVEVGRGPAIVSIESSWKRFCVAGALTTLTTFRIQTRSAIGSRRAGGHEQPGPCDRVEAFDALLVERRQLPERTASA